ncbi:(d)CMP kinase [Pseudoclavibacter sp. RFBJ3]|uniref:(d)CMP kinase n=1 Tax=unclassified Pseudoclavibacter TaxID=2615177 RepID=UPI000CE80666|nr:MULTISPECIES: (d)CMP kinase [unclassified Pseudoclavibacter]PPF86141.1 (d)CMP kinase [Pseudoclavibacter sp. RFBJ5]PPF92536.1 (d)CMP kinase [Pseudoclavibacter sp. RFBJ3]PPF97413.1 (d)CMP kinase [Pseudoclavibacter sp. RFBH5]PPG25070.1 (d)CMP kinase [Pseudoclavibacter sp. RFBI4]
MSAPASPLAASVAVAPLVVAVDGPAGSGKSSVCRESARRLRFGYLDTGAAYRALTWFAIEQGCDLDDAATIVALLPTFIAEYRISQSPDERWVRVGETDVSEHIRDTAISGEVWRVSRVPEARAALTALFRSTMAETAAAGIIAEGRDITTVVATDAPVRILMTADEAVRIARRAGEKAGEAASAVAESVSARDARDAKVTNFTEAADGVTVLDTTRLDFEQSVEEFLRIVASAPGSHQTTAPSLAAAPSALSDTTTRRSHDD